MTAKESLRYSPVGPFMSMSGAIFIDRGDRVRAVRSLEAAGESMKKLHTSVWIFPEGTRHSSEVPDMLSLKKGGFHLAVQAGVPIVPIVTENYWRMYQKGIFGSGKLKVRGRPPSFVYVCDARGLLIRVSISTVLPPISTTNLTAADVPALTIRVRDQMLAALRDISVKVPSGQPEKSDDASRDTTAPAESASNSTPSNTLESDVLGIPDIEVEVPRRAATSSDSGDSSTSSSSNAPPPTTTPGFSEGSENGTETEEDEGMVLVGRPTGV